MSQFTLLVLARHCCLCFRPVTVTAAVTSKVRSSLTGLNPLTLTPTPTLPQTAATHMEKVHSVSMGQPWQVWISEHLIPYLGTLEPCVDMHRTVSYIAWSYWGQERSGGTEALQMFFISGPQGKSVTATPGSFCSELGGRAVMLCHSLAIWLKITPLKDSTGSTLLMDCVM